MASVNSDIMVTSNTTAVISPMWMDDTAAVSVDAGENMPFAYVDWEILQSAAIESGATFMVTRTTMGANQEMEPTGDVAYVTCGPFECMEGMEAPAIGIANSSVCAGWDPELTLNVGLVDNDVFGTDEANADDGLDVGWVTSSTAAMTVKHMFSGVAKGTNYEVSGPDAAKGTNKALKMDRKNTNTADTDENNAYRPGIRIAADDMMELTPAGGANPSACTETGSYADTIGSNHRPVNCFRIVAAGGTNYLDGYSVEVSAKGSAVTWGSVEWENDPFEDLTCESMTVMAADQVDVCEMFEAEVDQALAGGWGGSKGTVTVVPGDGKSGNPFATELMSWTVGVPGATTDRFKTLWFDDDLNGKIRDSKADTTRGEGGPNDLYGGDVDDNITTVWQSLVDDDNDPVRGDFGKVDFDDNSSNTASDPDKPDGKADNYDGNPDAEKCSDDDGDGCDASWSDDFEVLFADGVFGCTTKRMLTITCEWDADGEMGRYRAEDHKSAGTAYKTAFTTSGATGTREAGYIGAFAKCTAK